VPEVTRALRALSSAYVERRHKVHAGATLDSAGKRAAFALFYGPLHFLCVAHLVSALQARIPESVLDTLQDSPVARYPLPKVLGRIVTPLIWRRAEQSAAVTALLSLVREVCFPSRRGRRIEQPVLA